MTDYIRKVVSGNKARFKDPNLNLELDLVYITDNVIIMGYPASGVEGLYRNRREDAKRFLDHRHGKNYWIFNFCPLNENSYDKNYFDGRRGLIDIASAPPLAIMPLLARDMNAWHRGSKDRVSVLHCKAGKGRSGTMACAYLLTLETMPSPPKLASMHLNAKQWAERQASEVSEMVPDDNDDHISPEPSPYIDETAPSGGVSDYPSVPEDHQPFSSPKKKFTESLHTVLELHSAQRMKPAKSEKKQRKGVSIASQRRFLSYWSLILSNEQPPNFWNRSDEPANSSPPMVRINKITVRMKESGSLKLGLATVASLVMDQVAKRKVQLGDNAQDVHTHNFAAPVWASLSKYDEGLIALLEKWERHTRGGEGDRMGTRKTDTEYLGNDALSELFDSSSTSGTKWDSVKMFRSFGRMGMEQGMSPAAKKDGQMKSIWTYELRSLSGDRWETVKAAIEEEAEDSAGAQDQGKLGAEGRSTQDLNEEIPPSSQAGIIVNAHREIRLRIYYGRVWMGWCWFIPAFHMQPGDKGSSSTTLTLTRKDLDFAVGLAQDIVDVEIEMSSIP